MDPFLQLFVGLPVTDPLAMSDKFFDGAEITRTTSTKIVLKDDSGGKVVFYGDYVIDGEAITGTMTGFKYKDEGVKLVEGGGYEINAADLLGALKGGGGPALEKDDAVVGPSVDILSLLTPDGIRIEGSDFSDRLVGVDADEARVFGRKGDDLLVGGEGNQVLKGNKGNDFIAGGGEKDKFFGGKGNDVFAFGFTGGPKEAIDPPTPHRIKDFSHKDDIISLSIDALDNGYLNSDYFAIGPEATSEDHRVIYDKDAGKLHYDEDGSGEMDQIHIGSLKAGTNLKAENIFINDGLFF
ncbi:MAG: hypothetical protein GY788_30365 [bacterium]|nr:hypothetical protein [bacterium]